MYDGAMARLMIEALPAAAVLHIIIAIWQFSESGVLFSPPLFGSNSGDTVAQLAGEDVTNSVGSFLFAASRNDASGLNIVARLSRENTLPLFVLLASFVTAWLLYRTAGVALAALVRQCCYVCSRGRWCHERPGVREELAFNPPFCGPFALPLDPKVTHKLTPFEERTGWKIVKDTASGLPGEAAAAVDRAAPRSSPQPAPMNEALCTCSPCSQSARLVARRHHLRPPAPQRHAHADMADAGAVRHRVVRHGCQPVSCLQQRRRPVGGIILRHDSPPMSSLACMQLLCLRWTCRG